MIKEDALKYAALLTAWAEGKTIEVLYGEDWQLLTEPDLILLKKLDRLRIKPEKVKLVVCAIKERNAWRFEVLHPGHWVITDSDNSVIVGELEIDPLPADGEV